ncbi:hypothetical protein ABTX81_00050 [Kitasatospora sp. NPDC097605]|uniref:hypothetical protein n=1 Tax=Kitasatospora sp. NPDC097605 TaxID=3157226 RepID=UPI0033255596
MRLVFECVECGSHYLPPEAMAYPDGPASPIWCARCQAAKRAAGVREDPLLARIALATARAARAAGACAGASAEEPVGGRPDVRPSRPPVSRRSRSGPGAVRSKLG